MKKACIAITLALCLVLSVVFAPAGADAANPIKVKINGTDLQTEVYPTIINDRTMVPMHAIFEALGADIDWDANMNLVSAVKGDTKVSIRINSKLAYINGQERTLESAPIILDSHTMVPVRFIAESLGEKVEWDGNARIVYIGSKTAPVKEEKPAIVTEYTLDKDTSLEYRAGCAAEFKKSTTINLYDNGYVKSGIINDDCWLSPAADRSANGGQVRFKAGTEATFFANGNLKSGTLLNEVGLKYAHINNVELSLIPSRDRNVVNFKAGTSINFNEKGYVASGIIAGNVVLPYAEYNALSFAGDTPVIFNDKGYVTSGTLRDSTSLPYRDNKLVMLKENTTVELNEDSHVITGTLKQDTELEHQGGYVGTVKFKKDTSISFGPDGYVKTGTLTDDTSLPYTEALKAIFKKETAVTFHDNGYISSGTILNTTSLPAADGTYQNVTGGTIITFDTNGKLTK
ncbi:MAG: copper amine oxidase N-terminal domain-containing protein [Syntrophomonadaceae bacterium]|nr:copper amine oxidase N-terminal domain-containing protein [Syntrophomonadaceae bacterium]